MFAAADLVVINKIDYLELAEFDLDEVRRRIAVLNRDAPVLPLSCRTGEGIDAWIAWLRAPVSDRPISP
jgi:hydrogenase nickel incorporation protein HypB